MKTETELKNEMEIIANEICSHLTDNWSCSPIHVNFGGSTDFTLTRLEDDLRLWVRHGGYQNQGRYEIMYELPRDKKGRTAHRPNRKRPAITCSDKKTAEKLAKDIERRLLPECKDYHEICMQEVKSANEYIEKERLVEELLPKIEKVEGIYFSKSGSSVQINGYVSIHEAIKISKTLNSIK